MLNVGGKPGKLTSLLAIITGLTVALLAIYGLAYRSVRRHARRSGWIDSINISTFDRINKEVSV